MTTDTCLLGDNLRRTGYQCHSLCYSCEDCPPHPATDPNWVDEIEERSGIAQTKERLRILSEQVDRIARSRGEQFDQEER